MQQVKSKDGTPIAFERSGEGPAVILVGGALSDRSAAGPLAALLSQQFTVVAYDRRGRGESGDTAPYAVECEVEDIEALTRAAGGSALVFGHSSGAALALASAAAGLAVARLALYEPPFIVDDSRPPLPADYAARLTDLVSVGRYGEAVEWFLAAAVGVPAVMLAEMRSSPMWTAMEKLAPTLLYDQAVMGDTMAGRPLPATRWAAVTQPTLVLGGGASPPWMRHAAQSLAAILPNARYRSLEGQTHAVDPARLAPVLVEFFTG
jgi:pimeloyl-ACP methyl ester carboxylesterase